MRLCRQSLASLDMPAERRGAADFYRAHDATLDAPHMGVMGGPVGGAMTAEDVRHLQGRAHGGHSSRRHHLQGQAVDRAPRLGNGGRRHLRIAGRRRQAVVAQKHLDDADVDAALEQMGSKAVPEVVQLNVLQSDPGPDGLPDMVEAVTAEPSVAIIAGNPR